VLLALLCRDRADDGSQQPGLSRERVVHVMGRPDVQVLLAEASPSRGDHPPVAVGVLVLRHGELLPLGGHPSVHVEQLWVHPDHRRRGVARVLLRAAAAIGEQWGLDDVVCAVPPQGREAHRFLARLGFAPVVTQRAVPVASLLRRLSGASEPARRRVRLDQVVIRRRREQRSAARPSVTV
jgi:GNAT superfamily N-acetyltransferase